ncbi:phage gp6-like head-tail connector protein [Micromonospora zamorensis]|uniref:phage gp6-like head-tail connector protein n=1 Tax=Micromonospora zamorensis TaxID=709883 RepID=UPI00371B8F1A
MPVPGGTSTLYADLAQLKAYLSIKDESRDVLLTQTLMAAARYIDQVAGRRFYPDPVPTTRVYRTRGRVIEDRSGDGNLLLVDDIADDQDLAVALGSPALWTTYTGWLAEPADPGQPITALRGWWSGDTVRVTATFGWPAPPDEVVQATLIQASRLWKRKDSPEGVAGSAEWGAIRLSRRDPDVQALIDPYTLPGFA